MDAWKWDRGWRGVGGGAFGRMPDHQTEKLFRENPSSMWQLMMHLLIPPGFFKCFLPVKIRKHREKIETEKCADRDSNPGLGVGNA
jgi:hypothetical protein